MTTYDLDQTAELIEAMRDTRMLVPVTLAVLCGLRRGEWRPSGGAMLTSTPANLPWSSAEHQGRHPVQGTEVGKARTVAMSATIVAGFAPIESGRPRSCCSRSPGRYIHRGAG